MAKHTIFRLPSGFYYFLLTVVWFIPFTSCNKQDNPDGPIVDYGNLFDCTYTVDKDGCCVWGGLQPISADVINDEVTGYGWKVIGIYEVQDNGRLSMTDYRKTVIGCGYDNYWFESGNHLVRFHHGDTPGIGNYYNKTEWGYDKTNGFIMRGKADQSMQSRYMQVLRFSRTELIYRQMYTIQKLGDRSLGNKSTEPFFGMVIYQRMTNNELAEMKSSYNYNADTDFSGSVPNSCKFQVQARYHNPDDFEEGTSGRAIVAFGKVRFSLTDNLGSTILPNPALEYFDSIIWRGNAHYLPDTYLIHRRGQSQSETTLEWTTYFLDKDPNLTTFFDGYKDGNVVYSYMMGHYIFTNKFLCYDWERFAMSNPKQHTVSSVLDRGRSFTVYEPSAYNGDVNKVYAELRYNSEEKGKGNNIAIMLKEARELTDLMTNHYGLGTDVGRQVEHYRTLFHALPEKAEIITYWETADTRIALVCNIDDTVASNNYYYVHAEPKQTVTSN